MDELINPTVVGALSRSLMAAEPQLQPRALSEAMKILAGQRLRDRVNIVRDAFLADAPDDFSELEQLVRAALEQPSFTGWMIWPVTEAVSSQALASHSTPDFDTGMDLLASLTPRLSSEFAVRNLLNARPERALSKMTVWARDENEHVRRLATEGSRAYLPWARRVPWLIEHPGATRAILDATYRDTSEYVRRSVANHLNDLSRVDPATVTRTARNWAENADAHTSWVIRRGLRTLIKNADPEALTLVGYSGRHLRVDRPELSNDTVHLEGALTFTAVITNEDDAEAAVAIDYSIGFQRSNRTISPKTFKLTSRKIAPGESVTVTKTHSFRRISTRTYFPGAHFVTVQANGTRSLPADFTVVGASTDESASDALERRQPVNALTERVIHTAPRHAQPLRDLDG
ncbi:DNA alkylation repair protein [Arthrobacter zhaoguopingii]|uniref:DNA alkylation repair protein n=1 Tax=Arthrobacter zhaoguopingii TaxID=2681491 RepID=UPI001FEA7338|nr:DNA alkylation repair protein [Arthrobacter zhaoguopingii]